MSVINLPAQGTSAGSWPSVLLHAGVSVVATALLAGVADSSSATVREGARTHPPAVQSNAGVVPAERQRRRAAEGLATLRRVGGFTWEQVARLFNVTRRSVHFWASGEAMTAEHEEHLNRVVAALFRMNRGSAAETRRAIMTPAPDGTIPFDLLAERRYDQAVALSGSGGQPLWPAFAPRVPEPPSEWRPEYLDGALEDISPTVPRASTRTRTRRGLA